VQVIKRPAHLRRKKCGVPWRVRRHSEQSHLFKHMQIRCVTVELSGPQYVLEQSLQDAHFYVRLPFVLRAIQRKGN
jgi:hypothetical protein